MNVDIDKGRLYLSPESKAEACQLNELIGKLEESAITHEVVGGIFNYILIPTQPTQKISEADQALVRATRTVANQMMPAIKEKLRTA